MKQLKILLASILILCIVSGSCFAAADTGDKSNLKEIKNGTAIFTDINDSSYKKAIRLISSLGIINGYEDGTFLPDKSITRAEFASMIVKLLGVEDATHSIKKIFFEDVPDDYWAIGEISMVFSLGLFNGYGDGNFGPDDPVKFEDAVKILVCALGYEKVADEKGGFPSGYLSVAAALGITKQLQVEAGHPLNRAEISQMIYNSLTVTFLEKDTSKGGNQYKLNERGDNFLSTTFKSIKSSGLVTSNGKTNLYGKSTVADDEVCIDSVIYKVGSTAAADFVGQVIDFYYKQENGDYILMMAYPKENYNNILEINADDISAVNGLAGGIIQYYSDNDKEKLSKAKLDLAVRLIYNGRAIPNGSLNYIPQMLHPRTGNVKLIDNNNDGTYDVAFVNEYKTYIAGGVDAQRNLIFLKYNQMFNGKPYIELDPKDSKITFSLLKNGKNVSVTSINEWDVLSVAADLDYENIDVLVSDKEVKGDIIEVTQDTDKQTVKIGDESYDTIKDYYSDVIKVGDSGILHLDVNGKVAAFEKTATAGVKYAYFIKAAPTNALSNTIQLQLFTTAGETVVIESKDRIKFSGPIRDYSTANPYIKEVVENQVIDAKELLDILYNKYYDIYASQLITYETDSDNKLIEINLAVDGYDKDRFSQDITPESDSDWLSSYPNGELPYKEQKQQFGDHYILTDSTVIFNVSPVYDRSTNRPLQLTDKDIKIIKRDVFKNDNWYLVKAYDTTPSGVVTVLVYEATTAAAIDLENSTALIIDKVSECIDPETEETSIKVSGYVWGEYKEFVMSDDCTVDTQPADVDNRPIPANTPKEQLKKGDIILYTTDSKGRINNYRPVFSIPDENTAMGKVEATGADYSYKYAVYYGVARSVDSSSRTLSIEWRQSENGSEKLKWITFLVSGASVYMIDTKTKTISLKSLSDIVTSEQSGDNAYKVLVKAKYRDPQIIVMYK